MSTFREHPVLSEVYAPSTRAEKIAHTRELKQAEYDLAAMKKIREHDRRMDRANQHLSYYGGELFTDTHIYLQQHYVDKLYKVRLLVDPTWRMPK